MKQEYARVSVEMPENKDKQSLRQNLTYERQTKFFAVDKDLCIGCGLCAKKCPVQAIEMQETTARPLVACKARKTESNKPGKTPVWTAERCALCLG